MEFFLLDNGNIIAPDGTEYVFLKNEGFVEVFGAHTLLGKVINEEPPSFVKDYGWDEGMYACENDPDLRILMRIVPNSEWRAYYRRADLPNVDLSLNKCTRFEFVGYMETDLWPWYTPDIRHLSCNEGITDLEEIKAFLSDIRRQKSPDRAGLWDLVEWPDSSCYMFGKVHGYIEGEPNLAIPLYVYSFDDKAYSIQLDNGKEYVLPEKWLHALIAKP